MKSVRVLAGLASLCFLMSACTTAKVKVEADKFSGGKLAKTDALPVVDSATGTSDCGSVSVCIAFKKTMLGDKVTYQAVVTDGGEFSRPVDAPAKDSLSLNVDGAITTLSSDSDGKSSESTYGGFFGSIRSQTLVYSQVPEALMQSLAAAKEVKVRLKGASREKIGFLRTISAEAIRNLIQSN